MVNGSNKTSKKESRFKFRVPHTLVLISVIMVLVAVATYIVPGGAYEKIVNDQDRTVVVEGSFQYIESNPQGIVEVLKAPIEGIVASASTIAFLFVIGGAFSLITRTKAIDLGIIKVVKIFKGKEILILPILMYTFSLGGAIFGMSEEAIAFMTILLPLMLALGYDSLLAVAVTYFACVLGFSSAMMNPFNVGVAQQIAGIPMFSGFTYRTILWFVMTTIGTVFVMFYANRIKKNPKLSPMYESDLLKREKLNNVDLENEEFRLSHKLILLTLAVGVGVIVWGVLAKGFWITEIAAVFLAVGLLSGFIGRLSGDEMADAFIQGAKDMMGAALMLGLAKGIVILAENAGIIDTILNALSGMLSGLPSLVATWIMYPVQMFINFFVNSGSGQAALTIPILAPLGDLIGIERQLTVLIFQLGDGFSNALFPTSGILLACLGLGGIPYSKWFKWILPIQCVIFAVALIAITIAFCIGWC